MGHRLPQRSISLCTSPKQGQSTTLPALLPSHHRLLLPAHQLVFWGSFSTESSAGSRTCNISRPSWPPRPTSSQGLRPQLGAPPYGTRGCSTLPSSVLPSQPAALHGGPPLTRHFSKKGLEKSYRKPKTDASEPLLEPTRLHQYEASWLKWECPRCLFTWTAGKPDFD
jgi:hypothetical protein